MSDKANSVSKEWFNEYVNAYNSEDFAGCVSSYYGDDIIFETPGSKFTGKKEVLQFFQAIHVNGKETMRPSVIIMDGDNIALQADIDFTFKDDEPQFFLKPAKKGEVIKMQITSVYKIRGGKISHIKVYEFGGPH